jgi:hypothetical protein
LRILKRINSWEGIDMKQNECVSGGSHFVGGHGRRLGKVISFLVIGTLLGGVARGELRTFKNAAGAEIKAEILYGTAEMVTIKLANGKDITTPIAKFSEEDQAYINEWIKTQPAKINYSFGLEIDKARIGDKKERQTKSHNVTEENWAYNLTLDNRTRARLEGLEIRYRMYVSSEHTNAKSGREVLIRDGILKVPVLTASESIKIQTKGVPLLKSDLKPDYVYKDGGRHRLSDDMAGLWVKVFHKGQRVWESTTSQKALKDFPFSDAEARDIGQSSNGSQSGNKNKK